MLTECPVSFESQSATLRGYLITRTGANRGGPAVIMAHGTSATIQMAAIEYARVFAKAGLAVLVYDHRGFGRSEGEPRLEINPWVQCRGYLDALTFAASLPEIDANRIALDDQGLYWFEEPITYDNIPGYVQLARQLSTPVQLGENFYGPRLLYQAVLAGAGDFVMPDMMRIGGVSGWMRSAAIASAAGIPMSTHLYPEIAAHLMRVTDTAHWLEWQDWADPILAEPFEIKDGQLLVPNRPGQGIARNEKAVAEFSQ